MPVVKLTNLIENVYQVFNLYKYQFISFD